MIAESQTVSLQQRRYSLAAIALHWLIAAAILFQIAVGWGLHALGSRAFSLFQLHKSIGLTILLLSVIRLGLKLKQAMVFETEGNRLAKLAKIVHVAFYFVMIAAPLSGWALTSTAKVRVPLRLFGLVPLPHLPIASSWNTDAVAVHSALAWIILGLLSVHVAGAFRHHFLLRDGLLWRVAPGRSAIVLALLLTTVPAAYLLGRAALPKLVPAFKLQPQQVRLVSVDKRKASSAPPTQEMSLPIGRPASVIPPPTWSIRPGGRLGFSVGSTDGAISGNFTKWSGRIQMDPDYPETAEIHMTINLASGTVGDSYKDDMLQGPDFFGSTNYPSAVFDAVKIRKDGQNGFRADGMLSLKGHKAPQSISFSLSGIGKSVSVKGSGVVRRQSFQVGLGDSAAGLTPDVNIEFAFTASSTGR